MPLTASSTAPAVAPQSFVRKATIAAIIFALLTSLYLILDAHLDWFYILNPTDLHDLSLRAIEAHGNDTAAVVGFITSELSEKLPGGYINLDEEWIFNNAGGAMGAMYIIHASKLLLNICLVEIETPKTFFHPWSHNISREPLT
jgi:C-8 sterol isomerase